MSEATFSLHPRWFKEALKSVETDWDKRFELMGIETLRFAILEAGVAPSLALPRPPQVKNPETGLLLDANPPIDYAIAWLVRRIAEEKQATINERKLAITMQRVALTVSILSAIATAITAASNVFLSVFQ